MTLFGIISLKLGHDISYNHSAIRKVIRASFREGEMKVWNPGYYHVTNQKPGMALIEHIVEADSGP
jgi:hypothetical protein